MDQNDRKTLWFNNRRLPEPTANTPPAAAKADVDATRDTEARAASQLQPSR